MRDPSGGRGSLLGNGQANKKFWLRAKKSGCWTVASELSSDNAGYTVARLSATGFPLTSLKSILAQTERSTHDSTLRSESSDSARARHPSYENRWIGLSGDRGSQAVSRFVQQSRIDRLRARLDPSSLKSTVQSP